MNDPLTLPRILLLLPVLSICLLRADAQSLDSLRSQEEFEKAGAALDAAFFDSYNRCDLAKFATFLADDLEFYHDQGGVTLGREKVTESVKQNICGKVTRQLVPGSLQIYPMKGYGLIEVGVHRFYHPGHDGTEPVGEARFTTLCDTKMVLGKSPAP